MARPRLYLSHDPGLDSLMALEFGCVPDGQPPRAWRGVSDEFAWYHGPHPTKRVRGFGIQGFSDLDPQAPELEATWSGPRFDAPLLGLSDSSAGEIALAAQAYFGDEPSFNRVLFNVAAQATVEADPEETLQAWHACLESGDAMAHFAIGYTLHDLGRHQEAYRHLRHYVEIAPHNSWNWCWYGKGAEAIGETEEARRAFERAIELEESGGDETDAWDLLYRLQSRE